MRKPMTMRIVTAAQMIFAAVSLVLSFVKGIAVGDAENTGADLYTLMTEQFTDAGEIIFWVYCAAAAAVVLCCGVQMFSNSAVFERKWTLALPTVVYGLGMVMLMGVNTHSEDMRLGACAYVQIAAMSASVLCELYKKYK